MSDDDLDLDDVMSGEEDLVEDEMVAKKQDGGDGRHRVEDKLEELRLQRLTQDYDFV